MALKRVALFMALLGTGCGSTHGVRSVAPPPPIIVNVFGEGFTQRDLAAFVAAQYDGINQSPPFDAFRAKVLKFVPYRLNAGELGVHPDASEACYFKFDANFGDQLKTQKRNHPGARETIVLLKTGDNHIGACAMSNDLIISSEFIDTTAIAHEFGHAIGGLKDETSGGGTFPTVQGQPHNQPNCAEAPGWRLLDDQGMNAPPLSGCEGYGSGVYRPTDDCRMASPDQDFCCVCKKYMIRHLNDLLKTSMPESDPRCTIPSIDVQGEPSGPIRGFHATAQFGNNASTEIEIGPAAFARPEIAAGDSFTALIVNDKAIATVGLPDPPDKARAYKPKAERWSEQKVEAPLPVTVTFFVPGTIPAGAISKSTFPIGDLSGVMRLDTALSRIDKIIETTGIPP